MMKKIIGLILLSQLIITCGFTPTLKNLDNQHNAQVYYEINSANSYIARQLLISMLQNIEKEEARFLTKIDIMEKESAVNVNSSGSVDEYKIEVLISFEIFDIIEEVELFSSQSRGFANYDVSLSEYTNSLVRKEALESALTQGIQLMNIIIQSKVNE